MSHNLAQRWSSLYERARDEPERFYMDPRSWEERHVRRFFFDLKTLDKKTWNKVKHLRNLIIADYRE